MHRSFAQPTAVPEETGAAVMLNTASQGQTGIGWARLSDIGADGG
jgi:hypothetical protein